MSYQFVAWNVDGYTEIIHNWLREYLETEGPDLVFLSETKRSEPILRNHFDQFEHYHYIINAHVPAQYHGVAMLIRKDHKYFHIPIQMNIPVRKDTQSQEAATGRIIAVQLNQEMNVIGSYTPNSGQADLKNLGYRTQVWDPAFARLLELLRESGPTVWMGDINVALSDLDASDPVGMSHCAGFTLQERQNLHRILSSGHWFDPWRLQHPQTREYSWTGYHRRIGYGIRLDNIIVSDTLLPKVKETYILSDAPNNTDHLPVVIVLNR